jgi:hypothetical protein
MASSDQALILAQERQDVNKLRPRPASDKFS